MKILTLHCDYIKWKPLKKAIREPEDIADKGEQSSKECLVVFTAVEKGDNDKTIEDMIEAVKKTSSEVKTKNIVLYPYAHLSSNLSDPNTALEYLRIAEDTLRKEKFSVMRAPFGYYKEFELKVKGHPLSELSKEFRTGEVKEVENIPKAIKVHEKENEDISKILREMSRSKLDTSKLKENDHRILGQKLDLFSFNEASPGSVFWHNNGLIIFNELVNYWREVHKKEGYQEVSTPQIFDNKLWKVSGHWKLYQENMFLTDYEGRAFGVKPMNCPGGMLIYKSKTRSYKDLPLRFGEIGKVHRKELSGVLAGLFRVIQFTQDDAHLFISEEQLEEEITRVIKLFREMLDKFKFEYSFTLSTRSEEKKDKYLGDDKLWESAESALSNALKKLKIKFETNAGEAKFYGPSLDVLIKDSLGREWQCSTLQLDFNSAKRFELEYTGKDNKVHTPIVLHRVVLGSIERFIGVLLEHLNGALPMWLSPIQVRVLNFTDKQIKDTEKVVKELREAIPQLRIESDLRNTTINDKVRDAEMMKIPYILVIGEKEVESGKLAVRERGKKKPEFGVSKKAFIEELKGKIENRN